MSGSEDQGGAGRREVAYRLFAAEFEDADFSYSESDEERAPNYVVTPTGGRVNRLFVVGVLTEVENASEDVLRARIVDPTGAFVVYAGQYQPEAQAFFERAEPPMFVAVTGKARTFQPDDSDVTYTSVRPENVNEVDAETRDRWTVGTARQTLNRVRTMARALAMDERGDELRHALEAEGVDTGLAAGIPLAIEHYGTTAAYLDALRHTAVQAAEVVAGERDEVDAHSVSPDAPGDADLTALAALDIAANVGGETTDLGGALDESAPASTDAVQSTDSTAAAATTGSGSAGAAGAVETETDSDDSAETTAETASSTGPSETATEPAESAPDATDPVTEPEPASDAGGLEPDAVEPTTDSVDAASEPVDAAAGTGDTATEPGDSEAVLDETDPGAAAGASGDDDLDDFDPGEFELDDEEREEIESEYGTEFQSGSEVGEPGEAGIETPDPEEMADAGSAATESGSPKAEADAEPTADTESSAETDAEPSTEAGPAADADPADDEEADATEDESADDESADDVDIEDAVMDAMEAHDDGDGASADDIVATVTDRIGADESAVRDAIQDALMDGRCYEPDDGVYKPI